MRGRPATEDAPPVRSRREVVYVAVHSTHCEGSRGRTPCDGSGGPTSGFVGVDAREEDGGPFIHEGRSRCSTLLSTLETPRAALPASVTPNPSPNFAYLAHHDARLVALATQAEEHFGNDPTVTLFKLRQFGEVLAQRAAAKVGLFIGPEEKQQELIDRLWDRNVIGATQRSLFHDLRRVGNDAVHHGKGDHREALHQLRMARELGVWFQRSFGNSRKFEPGPFIPPPEPGKAEAPLHDELQRLRGDVEAHRKEREAAARAIEARAEALRSAALEDQNKKLLAELAALQAAAQAMPPKQLALAIEQASDASEAIELDEAATRVLIDRQLRDAGWEVDSPRLTFEHGVRPTKGKNLAIAE
jgi:type I restriction enzyme, R subunit